MKTKRPAKKQAPEPVNETPAVDEFVAKLEHPFKAEIEAVRAIIKKANPKIGERVKWNAPSFFYKRDMAAFNLHAKEFVQIVFVFHNGAMIHDDTGLLEGDWKDRRMAKLHGMADVKARKAALVSIVNEWVALMDKGA